MTPDYPGGLSLEADQTPQPGVPVSELERLRDRWFPGASRKNQPHRHLGVNLGRPNTDYWNPQDCNRTKVPFETTMVAAATKGQQTTRSKDRARPLLPVPLSQWDDDQSPPQGAPAVTALQGSPELTARSFELHSQPLCLWGQDQQKGQSRGQMLSTFDFTCFWGRNFNAEIPLS